MLARRLLLFVGGLCLLFGLDAALLRTGTPAPVESASLADLHGALMLFGFLGTVISLERAVAVQHHSFRFRKLAYLSPLLSALATITLIASAVADLNVDYQFAAFLWAAAFLVLVIMYAAIWRVQPGAALALQILGAVAALSGALLWGRGYTIPAILPWWTAFLVFTIVGERLELARVAFIGKMAENRVVIEALFLQIALLLTLFSPNLGYALLGASLLALMLDMAAHDVARRVIKTTGITRFGAVCMLTGYFWGAVSGAFWLIYGQTFGGFSYDVVVHALTLGFAMAMIFAHVSVIAPAIAGRPIPYTPVFWVIFALLETGLVLRFIAAARAATHAWTLGAVMNVVTVLLFALTVVVLGTGIAKKVAS